MAVVVVEQLAQEHLDQVLLMVVMVEPEPE
jgi:hypothetical protein